MKALGDGLERYRNFEGNAKIAKLDPACGRAYNRILLNDEVYQEGSRDRLKFTRLLSYCFRGKAQKERYNSAIADFFDLLSKRYDSPESGKITAILQDKFNRRHKYGSPLTGYRVRKLLNDAESLSDLTKVLKPEDFEKIPIDYRVVIARFVKENGISNIPEFAGGGFVTSLQNLIERSKDRSSKEVKALLSTCCKAFARTIDVQPSFSKSLKIMKETRVLINSDKGWQLICNQMLHPSFLKSVPEDSKQLNKVITNRLWNFIFLLNIVCKEKLNLEGDVLSVDNIKDNPVAVNVALDCMSDENEDKTLRLVLALKALLLIKVSKSNDRESIGQKFCLIGEEVKRIVKNAFPEKISA